MHAAGVGAPLGGHGPGTAGAAAGPHPHERPRGRRWGSEATAAGIQAGAESLAPASSAPGTLSLRDDPTRPSGRCAMGVPIPACERAFDPTRPGPASRPTTARPGERPFILPNRPFGGQAWGIRARGPILPVSTKGVTHVRDGA